MTHADIKSLLSRSGLCLGLVLAFGCYGARETVPINTPMSTPMNASTSVAMNSTDRATVRQLETAIAETIIQGILQ